MIVLDTDILVAVLRRDGPTQDKLERLESIGERFATTSLNVAETLRGFGESPALAGARVFLDTLIELPFGPRAARRFGRLMHAADRAGAPMATVDAMIAAVTLEEGARLATRNVRDFDRVPGLELVPM